MGAPTFPYGIIDDISGAAEIARRNDIGLHVDSCLGGFLTLFLSDTDEMRTTPTDFQCAGVTSISLDSHKYGLNGKGSSIAVFRASKISPTMSYIPHNCGAYVTPGISGS